MKKLLLLALMVLGCSTMFASCKNQSQETKSEENSQKEKLVVNMTKEMFLEKVFDFTKDKEWEFKGDKPIVIDLYATWCGPCRAIAPIIEELAEDYKGKVNFYKVDVDKQKEIAGFFNVSSIPYLVFIPAEKGAEPQFYLGGAAKATYKRIIDQYLVPKK